MPTYISKYDIGSTGSGFGNFPTSASSTTFDIESDYTAYVFASLQDYNISEGDTILPEITDNKGLKWNRFALVTTDLKCPLICWYANVNNRTTGVIVTLTYTDPTANNNQFGGMVVLFQTSAGVGTVSTATGTANSPTVSIIPRYFSSALIYFVFDWIPNTAGSRTWGTINGVTPTSANGYELTYQSYSGYMIAGCYYPDLGFGSNGVTFNPIMNHSSPHDYTVIAVEIPDYYVVISDSGGTAKDPTITAPRIDGIFSTVSNSINF